MDESISEQILVATGNSLYKILEQKNWNPPIR